MYAQIAARERVWSVSGLLHPKCRERVHTTGARLAGRRSLDHGWSSTEQHGGRAANPQRPAE